MGKNLNRRKCPDYSIVRLRSQLFVLHFDAHSHSFPKRRDCRTLSIACELNFFYRKKIMENLKIIFVLIFGLIIPFIDSKTLEVNIYDSEEKEVDVHDPPPHTEYAKMARWLVHNSEWMATGTISTIPSIKGFPMVNVIAMADSAKGGKSTGQIYFLLVMLDFTAQDLSKRNEMTALFTMDQSLYCTQRNIDPMEPTCARIMISGEALRVEKNTKEYEFASNAMVSHHPASENWINAHDFFLCKMNITQICVLDWYGGPHFVSVEDYFKVALDGEKSNLRTSLRLDF